MTDLERIKAICQSFIEESEHQVTEVGEAGAHDAVMRAASCRIVLKAIDGFPDARAFERIPEDTRRTLDDYAGVGLPPGDCMRAVLSGDLFQAFARADAVTVAALPAIVTYVVSRMPSGSWGSHEIVSRWIARPRS